MALLGGRLASAVRAFLNYGRVAPADPASFVHVPWMREAGVFVTQDTALGVSAFYGCCRLIVDSLASAPIVVSENMGKGRRQELPDDPVSYLLNYGSPIDQARDALPAQAIEEALFWSALSYDGNGYAEIQRDGAKRPFALWPLDPARVTPRRDETGFWYEVTQPAGGSVRVEARDMFHVRGPSLFGWMGDGITARACKAIGIAHASQAFAAAYFANGTIVSGLLSSDKIISREQAEQARKQWVALHAGSSNAHGVAVTGQGLKYQPVGHNAQEAQLVEGRRFQIAEVARFFGVPTTLLADNEAWTNLSELYLGFYRNALRPWAERFDAEATRKLFPQKAPWREVSHDLTALTLGSFKDQVSALSQAVNDGLWTRNEARHVFGKNDIEGGDVLVVSGGVKPLEDVLEPPAPAPAAVPAGVDDADEPDDDGTEEDSPPPPPATVARIAVALDRFARRMDARRRDLERNAPDKLDSNLADERARGLDQLRAEFVSAGLASGADLNMRVERIADAVLAGEPAHLAAERFYT